MQVIKRDGRIVKFSRTKVEGALKKAFKECKVKYDKTILNRVLAGLFDIGEGDVKEKSQTVDIERIQDIIENELMNTYPQVAKAFILYREQHRVLRDFIRSKEQFINRYKEASTTADATIDDNSNVHSKNIGVLNNEIHKQDNLQVSRGMVMRKYEQLFPGEDPKQYLRDLSRHIIYKHDESSFAGAIAPYCVSVTMYPFLLEGIKGIGGLSAAPRNLDSYCGMYINMIFAIASQFAGAVATSEFLLYFCHFAKKEWGEDFYKHPDQVISTDGKKTIRKQIHQYFQQVIYSINQPAASRGMQSAFVNFSYFDKAFFEGMFGEFVFPDGSRPDWESLSWLQRDFMMWFNEERLRCVLTFPVESFALVYKDGKFVDEGSARFVAQEYARGHSFFTYISDSVDSLSSCCFKGDEVIKVCDRNGDVFNTTLKDFVDYNDDKVNKDGNSHMWDKFSIDSYNLSGKKEKTTITGTLKKKYTGNMYTFITGDNEKITVTADHELMVRNNNGEIISIKAEDVAKNIDSYELVTDIMDFKKITKVEVTPVVDEIVYDIELRKNHYFAANNIITHNCRLKNKVQTKEFNFTNGNMGLTTGSKSVITLNLNRIVQDWWDTLNGFGDIDNPDYDSLREYLTGILERVYKYHICYNELLWDMYDANLLSVYKAGFIDLNKQYLTIGINGLNEAAQFLQIPVNENERYRGFCRTIFGCIKENNTNHNGNFIKADGTNTKHRLTFNTECVPAESLAIKNYNWDKADGYVVPKDRNLYASYMFIPSDSNVSVTEKIRLHGAGFVGDWLDGGQACHINLEEHLFEEQYMNLLNYAAETGCSYFTFNIPNSECKDCGYIAKYPFDRCPKCGSGKVIKWDRIIGYLTAIPGWNEGRRIEQKTRVYTAAKDVVTE